MDYRVLGKTGLTVSALSFGASSLGSVFRDVGEADGIRAVHLSLELGINFIDVSPFYGLTKAETVLGKALKTVPRDKYILATKVGRYGMEEKDFDFSAARVTASVDESLQRMGVDYIDLIQCHDIEFGDVEQIITQTIPALRKVQKAGKVRFVGITGLPLLLFKRVADRVDIDTILSYCHYEMNDTALADLIPYLKTKGIGIISASPLGMGLLSNRGTPPWHPAPPKVKELCVKAAAHCKARGADIEKLAVQYSLANPEIATTLVGSGNPENMRKNIAWLDEPIDQQLLAEVQAILRPIHNITWPSGRPQNNS
jgi:L-galactose dehydrogenase